MSVARNLYLGNEPRGRWGLLGVNEMNRNAGALLRRHGIDVDVRRPVRSFGAGVQQMIAIVRAVSTDAQVVILDEPTSSLEPREVAQVFDMIRRLRTAGVALLFVSHKLDEVFAIADRITILRDGRRAHVADQGHDQAGGDRHDARPWRRRGSLGGTHELRPEPARARRRGARSSRPAPAQPAARRLAVGPRRRGARSRRSARLGPVRDGAGDLRHPTPRRRERRGSRRRVRTGSPRASLAAGTVLLPEDRKAEGIVPTMSVRDNIVLMALPQVSRWGFIVPRRVDRVVSNFIARLGIKTSGGRQNIGQLSGGNQQKTLLARLLCTDPQVLLLDEPTRGINIGAKAEVQALVQQLADQGGPSCSSRRSWRTSSRDRPRRRPQQRCRGG